MALQIVVREESPRQEEIALLLRQSDTLAAQLYPGEYRRPLNPETLDAPGIYLFVARMEGAAAGCCALFDGADATAELKRMIVGTEFRNRGIGTALLQAAEAAAVARDIRIIRMEVGIRNTDGQALYRRAGYAERGPFGSYELSPISLFFEKTLSPPAR
jgi:putative acetyltransferase